MIRRDAKRQGISYRQFFDALTISCNTFQKCETKLQTCPIVNLAGSALSDIRRRRKKFSLRNRFRAQCASQAKSEKSLQPQKNKGSAAICVRRFPPDSPDGGIAQLGSRRYSKIRPKSPGFISFLWRAAARNIPRLSSEKTTSANK